MKMPQGIRVGQDRKKEGEVEIPEKILTLLRRGQQETKGGTMMQGEVLAELRNLSDEQLAAIDSQVGAEWWGLAGTHQQPYGRGAPLTTGQVLKDLITEAKRWVNKGRLQDLNDYRVHLGTVRWEREWTRESANKTEIWQQRFADAEAKGIILGPAVKEAVLNFFVRDRMRHASYKGDQFLRNEQALVELAAAFPEKNIPALLAEWMSHKNPLHKEPGDQYDVYNVDGLIYYGLLDLFGVQDPFKENVRGKE